MNEIKKDFNKIPKYAWVICYFYDKYNFTFTVVSSTLGEFTHIKGYNDTIENIKILDITNGVFTLAIKCLIVKRAKDTVVFINNTTICIDSEFVYLNIQDINLYPIQPQRLTLDEFNNIRDLSYLPRHENHPIQDGD